MYGIWTKEKLEKGIEITEGMIKRRNKIASALSQKKGDVYLAAQVLKMKKQTLERKMKEFGLK